jgi:hypothetical protein
VIVNNFIFFNSDKPSQPEGPMVVREVSAEAVVIEWKPPQDDGGLEISQFIIEKCDPDQKAWIKIADVDKDIDSYCIQKLVEDAQYLFRVTAQNPVGVSEPLESDPVTIKGVASEYLQLPRFHANYILIFYFFISKTITTTWTNRNFRYD